MRLPHYSPLLGSCIAERFARAELRALLAACVGTFGIGMADPTEKVIVGGIVTSKPVKRTEADVEPCKLGSTLSQGIALRQNSTLSCHY